MRRMRIAGGGGNVFPLSLNGKRRPGELMAGSGPRPGPLPRREPMWKQQEIPGQSQWGVIPKTRALLAYTMSSGISPNGPAHTTFPILEINMMMEDIQTSSLSSGGAIFSSMHRMEDRLPVPLPIRLTAPGCTVFDA